MEYTQACLATTKDYMGNTVFETRVEEDEVVVCNKKGIRVESLPKTLAAKLQ